MSITAWLGSYPSLVGNQSQSLNPADFFSFVMISVGIIVYNWLAENKMRYSLESRERIESIEIN